MMDHLAVVTAATNMRVMAIEMMSVTVRKYMRADWRDKEKWETLWNRWCNLYSMTKHKWYKSFNDWCKETGNEAWMLEEV